MTENKFWKSKDVVDRYQRTANIIIPDRIDIVSKIANLAIMFASNQPKILDLGCGSGDVTAEIIKQRPIFGVGPGNFLPVMMVNNLTGVASHFPYPVHNLYLLFASEWGLPALLSFLLFLKFNLTKRSFIFKKKM